MADIYLNPGDYRFAAADTRMHTVLGSCISITMWHAGLRIGGMCHYMLPCGTPPGEPFNARYADGAIAHFLRDVRRTRTSPDQYEVKMFGGGQQFPHLNVPSSLNVANHNIEAGGALLRDHGFTVSVRQLGGTGARRLIFDVATGTVWMRALAVAAA
ncbi:chemotaxis protein CheD [Actinoplanes awajinensis]|uniref:chemotaxis protein CheD n=1 Tax=Actinoplanes awajinensis TaxID=135946 RepID=UPI000A520DC6|nr:chemotaxis protein CheD [Actinoplanes awajinensis]